MYAVRFQKIPIVHFMRHDHFLSMVDAKALRLKRLDLYSGTDDFEGRYPAENAHSDSSIDTQVKAAIPMVTDKQAMIASQNIARTFAYIHCWYEGPARDPKMWQSEYSHGGKAVCISTDTKALQAAYGTGPNHLQCEPVRCTYRDENETIPEMFSAAPSMRKLRKFDWENEIRILARIKPTHHVKDEQGFLAEAPPFETLPIDLSLLIHELVLGPNLSADEVGAIIAAVSPIIPAGNIKPLRIPRA